MAEVIARVNLNEAPEVDAEVRYFRTPHSPDGRPSDPKSVTSVEYFRDATLAP